MEPSASDISHLAAALMQALRLPVASELLPDVLALLRTMADSSEHLGQALRDLRGGQ